MRARRQEGDLEEGERIVPQGELALIFHVAAQIHRAILEDCKVQVFALAVGFAGVARTQYADAFSRRDDTSLGGKHGWIEVSVESEDGFVGEHVANNDNASVSGGGAACENRAVGDCDDRDIVHRIFVFYVYSGVVTTKAFRLHGRGLGRDENTERFFRDARLHVSDWLDERSTRWFRDHVERCQKTRVCLSVAIRSRRDHVKYRRVGVRAADLGNRVSKVPPQGLRGEVGNPGLFLDDITDRRAAGDRERFAFVDGHGLEREEVRSREMADENLRFFDIRSPRRLGIENIDRLDCGYCFGYPRCGNVSRKLKL